jgi:hypothetical protein
MLAGPTFDGRGLVSPRWTGTGINASRVLQNVGIVSGSLNFGGFAVGEVWHILEIGVLIGLK